MGIEICIGSDGKIRFLEGAGDEDGEFYPVRFSSGYCHVLLSTVTEQSMET